MMSYPLVPDALDLPKPGSFLKNTLDRSLPVLLYFRHVDRQTHHFLKKMPANSTHSETIAGKPIDISLPAILWSFDTISESTSSV